jgi:hypothetical protein
LGIKSYWFKYSKKLFSRLWYSNSSFSFWWLYPPVTGATEEYDGSTWTTSNSLNTARRALAGAGTQTAALAFGGYTTALLQEQQKNMMEQVGQLLQ